jgi:hypothetical protein
MKHTHTFKFSVNSILKSEIQITYYEPININKCIKRCMLLDYSKSRNVFKNLTALKENISMNNIRRLRPPSYTVQNLLGLRNHVEVINNFRDSGVFRALFCRVYTRNVRKFNHFEVVLRRSQWPRGLGHESSSLARTLGSWVRIPLKAWMSVCGFILYLCCPVCR